MRDRTRVKAMMRIRRLQGVNFEQARAQQARAEALEADARSVRHNAEAEAHAAFSSWEGSLRAPRFDPDHAGRLSALLMTREDALLRARETLVSAGDETAAARARHADRAAVIEQTDDAIARLRRRLMRRTEEAAMAAVEDRIGFAWVRR
jgi:hypothetical protein